VCDIVKTSEGGKQRVVVVVGGAWWCDENECLIERKMCKRMRGHRLIDVLTE
jgi:hypothetical protein